MKNPKLQIKPIGIAFSILILFWVYNYIESNVLFVMGCVLLFCWSFFGDADSVFLSILVLIPNVTMIKHLSSPFALLGYAILIFEYLYIFKVIAKKRRLCFSAEAFYFLLSAGLTFFFTFSSSYLMSAVRVISFAFFSYHFFAEKEHRTRAFYDKMIFAFCLGIASTVVLGVAYWLAMDADIFVGYFSGIRNDRNYFSATLSLGVAISVLYIFTSKQKYFTRKYPILVIIMIAGGLLSGSRTFMASLLIPVFIILGTVLSSQNINKMFILIVIFIGCVFVAVSSERITEIILSTLERFFAGDMSGGNGRFETWGIYLKDYASSVWCILFGKGSEAEIMPKMETFMATHNTIIQGLYCGGFFGLVAYFLVYFNLFARLSRHKKLRFIELLPIADLLLCRFFIASYMSDTFSFEALLAFIVAVYRVSGDKEDESCSNQRHLWSGEYRENSCCYKRVIDTTEHREQNII